VTVGFTAGIAVIISASPMSDLLGLTLPAREPSALVPKLSMLAGAIGTVSAPTVAVTAVSLAIILVLRRTAPKLPGFLIAIMLAAGMAALLAAWGLPVSTIGSKFGGIPGTLPALPCRRSRSRRSASCCPRPLPSRCWAASNRCCPRSSPTA
jgi:SulP family sulfate permease